jgi:hypothetical protein
VHEKAGLAVTSFVQGTPERAVDRPLPAEQSGQGGARIHPGAGDPPWQVNPPTQFLNTVGGFSRIDALDVGEQLVRINGEPRIYPLQVPDARFASTFDGKLDAMHLASESTRPATAVKDSTGMASGALLYTIKLEPGQSREVAVVLPQTGGWAPRYWTWPRRRRRWPSGGRSWAWSRCRCRRRPGAGRHPAHRSGAHADLAGWPAPAAGHARTRSWIRDGAMISEGLLRMGRSDAVRDYINWYAPYQFENGKVPCCVDARGSDPVPENDSHGELIYSIAEYGRYTGDSTFAELMWPHAGRLQLHGAAARQRAHRREPCAQPAFYGMMPASISHEGYSAKPMHSYWDNLALRGYKDAASLAAQLGKVEAMQIAESRDQFRDDLQASLLSAMQQHNIDYLPGSAELGDFDATSTTIALARAVSRAACRSRRWRRPSSATGRNSWPAAMASASGRTTRVAQRAAFVRLGWRDRAWQATEFFKDQRRRPGTSGPKWSRARRASRSSSVTCRMPGWPRLRALGAGHVRLQP